MGLKEKLKEDLTEAIRSRDEIRVGTIRMVLTAIQVEEVSGNSSRTLEERDLIKILSREAKKRREAAVAFQNGGRSEKAKLEIEECEIINSYLPKQLTDNEINEIIKRAIESSGVKSVSQLGIVMKIIQPEIAGRADGAIVLELVKLSLLRDRKSTRLNSSHSQQSRMPSSA